MLNKIFSLLSGLIFGIGLTIIPMSYSIFKPMCEIAFIIFSGLAI